MKNVQSIILALAINAICFISIIFEDMKLPLHMETCCSVINVHTKFGVDIGNICSFKFKSLMLAYRVLDGSAPTYLNALVRANVTPRMLRSSSERRLALP